MHPSGRFTLVTVVSVIFAPSFVMSSSAAADAAENDVFFAASLFLAAYRYINALSSAAPRGSRVRRRIFDAGGEGEMRRL